LCGFDFSKVRAALWLAFYFVGPLWFVLSGRSIRFVGPQLTPNPLPRSHPLLRSSLYPLRHCASGRGRDSIGGDLVYCRASEGTAICPLLRLATCSVSIASCISLVLRSTAFFISFFSYFVVLFDFDLCRALLSLFYVASGVGQRTPNARSLVAKNRAWCLKG
jgi:hypothetical protein